MNDKTKNPKINKKSLQNIAKLSTLDKRILTIAKQNPNLNNHQIGKQLVKEGLSKNKVSIYSRLSYSELLRAEIDKIHTHNHEYLAREVLPVALKVNKRVLKDKAIEDKDKKDWVALAYKSGFKQEAAEQAPRTITIGQINVLQGMVRDNTAIDVTPRDDEE